MMSKSDWRSLFAGIRSDLPLTLRFLRKSPGFTTLVVFSLALGIGANTAMFSLIDGMLLRTLPVPNPEQIVSIDTPASGLTRFGDSSYPDYVDLRDQCRSFSGLAAYRRVTVSMNPADAAPNSRPEVVWGLLVSGNYFSTFRAEPAKGRAFAPDEDQAPDKAPVVVISDTLWRRSFGGDPQILGKSVKLNGRTSFTIIGVTPASFAGADLTYRPDIYIPIMMSAQVMAGGGGLLRNRSTRGLTLRGRLSPGVTVAQAQIETGLITKALERDHPDTNKDIAAIVRKEFDRRVEFNGVALPAILLGLAILVLLIACANVANLMMARATSRLGDMATQLALGAPRGRLISQLMTESAVLSVVGGAVGLALGYWGIEGATALAPSSGAPIGPEFRLDTRVAVYAFAGMVSSIFISGLAPAFMATREAVRASLKIRTSSSANLSFAAIARRVLIGGQVSVSIVLLIGAGLFMRAFVRAQDVDLGFNPNNVLLLTLDPSLQGYSADQTARVYKDLLERTAALPTVKSAALARIVPFVFLESWDISVDGYTAPNGEKMLDVLNNRVGPGYFETVRIPLIEGRDFSENDKADKQKVAVVNEEFARRYIAGAGNPAGALGRVLRLREAEPIQIVGVVKNSAYGLNAPIGSPPAPVFYVPAAQHPAARMTLHVRVDGDPAAIGPSIRQEISNLGSELAPIAVRTFPNVISGNGLLTSKISASLSGAFGLIALMLAIIGIHGVVSFMVERRTHEIGIRMCLGAQRSAVLRMILFSSISIVAIGLVAGVAGALALSPLLSSLLMGLNPLDAPTFIVIPLILLAAAVLASWIPASRATRVEPVTALRYE